MTKESWVSPLPGAKWVRTWRLGEWLTEPVSPLFETLVVPALTTARETGGSKHLGWKLPPGWHLKEPWYCVINGYFFARADFNIFSFIRFLLVDVPRVESAITHWQQKDLPNYIERLEGFRAFQLKEASFNQLLIHTEELCADAGAWWHLISLDAGGASFMERFFSIIYQRLLGAPPPLNKLLGGIESPLMMSEQKLYQLIRQFEGHQEIREALREATSQQALSRLEKSSIGQDFLSELRNYLAIYGHQVLNLDIVFPTPQEDPSSLIPLLRKMMDPSFPDPVNRFASMVSQREQAEAVLLDQLKNTRFRRKILGKLLQRCQILSHRRETTVFRFQWLWPLLRSAVLELGQRLTDMEVLDDAESIFFLTKEELWKVGYSPENSDLATLKTQSNERKKLWNYHRTLTPPERIPPVDDSVWNQQKGPIPWGSSKYNSSPTRQELKGLSASSGRAIGRARIIHSSAEFDRFQKGEILIAVTTNPAWTPLFSLAAAIVTESGGMTSHASIVAREYGIPAVVGTGCATKVIQDSQLVEVDGDNGVVLIEKSLTD
jgi:pyruvate,water dikinase